MTTTSPTSKTKLLDAFKRFGKVVAAAAVAVAITKLPILSDAVPYGIYGVAGATAILSALEKFLTAK
jgi:hypothetical protein